MRKVPNEFITCLPIFPLAHLLVNARLYAKVD